VPAAAAPPAGRSERHPLAAALASQAGIRQAWLLKEVLGPPRALRPVERELES
jgi:hypothetical protein